MLNRSVTKAHLALVVFALVAPSIASAEERTAPIRWEHRCAFTVDPSLGHLQGVLNAAGLDGWELVAVWPVMLRRNRDGVADVLDVGGLDYCIKRALTGPPPTPPAPPPPKLPAEPELVAALGSARSVLTACRDTYARGVTQLAVTVTVASSGRIEEATLSDSGANGPRALTLADCVEHTLKLVTLAPFHGAPTVIRTTLTLPTK